MTLNQPKHEPKITPEEMDPAVRFADDPTTARGTPRKKSRPADKEEMEERLNFARARMLAGASDGDIKRAMVRKYGITGRGAEKYITVARRRIREYVGISGEDAAAAALAYYSKSVMEFEVPCQMVLGRLVAAQKRLANVDALLANPSLTREERSQAEDARESLVREIDSLWKDYARFKSITDSSRRRIEDITGAAAPTKVALTTATGDDVLRAAEPATPAAATAEILAIMGQLGLGLTVEASPGTVDSVSPGATERTSED